MSDILHHFRPELAFGHESDLGQPEAVSVFYRSMSTPDRLNDTAYAVTTTKEGFVFFSDLRPDRSQAGQITWIASASVEIFDTPGSEGFVEALAAGEAEPGSVQFDFYDGEALVTASRSIGPVVE